MKRGISMFPFLLIFVLITGAIILIFFFQFGTDIQSSSEKVNKLTILKNIDQQLAAFSFPNNALNPNIDLGIKSEIKIECSDMQTNLIFGDKILKSNKLITSPITIKGRSIQAWTLSWDYPFKIDNFYYLILGSSESQNVKIFIKEPQFPNNGGCNAICEEQKEFIGNFKFFYQKINSPNSIQSSQYQNIVLEYHSHQQNYKYYEHVSCRIGLS